MAGEPPQQHDTKPPAGWFTRFLNTVEWLGNLLPHPVTLFACFAVGIVLLSGVAAWFGLSVVDPRPEGIPGRSADGIIHVMSLVSVDGLQRIVSNLVANFTGSPPLGVVLVALLFLLFIAMCGVVNLTLGSASAQWAITAPIFVPMLMIIYYSPEVIQAAYRIGDSVTNIITPMMSYFGLILAVACRYQKQLGIGTLIAIMLPYSMMFFVGWSLLFFLCLQKQKSQLSGRLFVLRDVI